MKKKTVSKKKVQSKSEARRIEVMEKPEKLQPISQFTFKDVDVNLIFRNGMIGYTFEKDGKTFGQKVRPAGRSAQEIASATFLILVNFVETLEAVQLIKE